MSPGKIILNISILVVIVLGGFGANRVLRYYSAPAAIDTNSYEYYTLVWNADRDGSNMEWVNSHGYATAYNTTCADVVAKMRAEGWVADSNESQFFGSSMTVRVTMRRLLK